MKIGFLEDLYLEQLQALLDSKGQLISVLPRMLEDCTSQDLREALEEHLETAQEQAGRLERILAGTSKISSVARQKCIGMEGLIREAIRIGKDMSPGLRDAAIIAAIQRIVHYEIAAYGTVRTYATLLNDAQCATLLEQTLEEEKDADRDLTEIAEQVNGDSPSLADLPRIGIAEDLEVKRVA
ncbi:MAG TPA: DUF892 family protein [Terriglobales bacterium]|jgi:ferritin-like metal-binding protein YciE